jgi:glycosyltransferase involved in cell wall biosynthesis
VFSGYVSKDKLNENLNIGDVSLVIFNDSFKNVLMPSKYYGLLACKKPVILISCTQNDISRDIEKYKIGEKIKINDYKSLALCIERMAKQPEVVNLYSSNSINLYNEKYEKEKILKMYLDVVRKYAK